MLYYFTLLGRFTMFASDVNLAVLSACFIPVFLYYFEAKKYLVSFVILILALFSRENIAVWFIFIFIGLIIQHRKDKPAVVYSLYGIAVSVLYFVLLFKVFIPSIETPGVKYTLFNYSALGETPKEALTFVLNHPIDSVKMFFVNHSGDPANDGIKAELYWVFLVSGGFILFLRPQYLLWFVPIVAQKVLNDNPVRWGIATYYSIEIVTLLPVTVFLILSSLRGTTLQKALTIAVCVATISMTAYKMDVNHNKVTWAIFPEKTKFYDKVFYKAPFDVVKVNKLLDKIPDKGRVSASNSLVPHIAQRQFIYFFPAVRDAEYLVMSVFDDNYRFSHAYNQSVRDSIFSDSNWEITDVEYPVFLLKRESKGVSPNDRAWAKSDSLLCNYEKIDSIAGNVLFQNGERADAKDLLSTEKSRSAKHSLLLTKDKPFSTALKISDADSVNFLQLSVWCQTTSKNAILVASGANNFYKSANECVAEEPSGWKKLILNTWLPKSGTKDLSVYLWNNGTEPVYFDDFQIVKKYLRP